jgi:hypothetical protein
MNNGNPHLQSPMTSAWRLSQEVELIVGAPLGGGKAWDLLALHAQRRRTN